MKSVQELMTRNPCSIDADKSVAYAAKMLRDEDVGLAPIVEGDRLVGTVTDRDITIRVVAEGKDPVSTKVKDIASINLVTGDPRQDLDEALKLMAKHQVRRQPGTEQGGRLVGLVAQADIAKSAADKQTGRVVEQISQ